MKNKNKIDKHVKIVDIVITDITHPPHKGSDLQKIRVN